MLKSKYVAIVVRKSMTTKKTLFKKTHFDLHLKVKNIS